MNPTQLDQLRDSLRREAQHIQPVGLGPDTVQHRGRRRRNRGRTVAAVCTATCVAGLGVTVLNRQGGTPHTIAVARSAGAGPAPTLEFRTITGSISYTTAHFTSPAGVTYALSTAPSVAGQPGNPSNPGQAIYRTTDGEHWTAADQGPPWITDLTEHDGVLYAVGTAPGSTAADAGYHVGTSNDGGQQWTSTNLPFDLSTPSAGVALTRSSAVQIARGPSSTLALLSEQFSPNLDALVAAKEPGKTNLTTRPTAGGFDIVDLTTCMNAKGQAVATTTLPPDGVAARVEATCKNPPALATITWAEMGLSGPGDLTRQQMLVSTDGTHWNTASAPATGYVHDLVATNDGFLLLADSPEPAATNTAPQTSGTTVLHSTDATHWTAVNTPAGLNVDGIAGDRIVGVDATGAVQTSTDGGLTWNTTDVAAQLPVGAAKSSVAAGDAGPLGFGLLVMADKPNGAMHGPDYLLFSPDGINWSTSDLAAAGEPADAYPNQVTVGADHIAVDYEGVNAQAGPAKITTLLATPKR